MSNPYHDENGRFCSKGEMLGAIDRLGKEGKLEEYFVLRSELETIERNQGVKQMSALEGDQSLPTVYQPGEGASEWAPTEPVKSKGMFSDRFTGTKYDANKSMVDIAKDVRGEVKDAVSAGYLPGKYKYSVRKDSSIVGQDGLNITVTGVFPKNLQEFDSEQRGLRKKLRAISEQYNSSEFAPQVDYMQTRFYSSVMFESLNRFVV